jgi:hypothetical protein
MGREKDPMSDFHPQRTRERNLELAWLYMEEANNAPEGTPAERAVTAARMEAMAAARGHPPLSTYEVHAARDQLAR